MKKIIFCFLIALQVVSTQAEIQNITFLVDMTKSKLSNLKSIELRGSIAPLSWDKSKILSDTNQDGIFEITVPFDVAENTILEYKYLCNGVWEKSVNKTLKIKQNLVINDVWQVVPIDKTMKPYTFIVNGATYSFNQRMHSEQVVHGVSQLVMKNGKVDTLLTYGYRDVAKDLPVDANTLFHIGGMGVSITSFAILRAAEKGMLDLDKPINNYLKTWTLAPNKSEPNVVYSTRDLLMSKIELNNVDKPYGYVEGAKIPTLLQLLNGEKPSKLKKVKVGRSSTKATNFSVSAGLIGQQLLEDVYGKPYADIIEMEVLQPLKMTRTIIGASLNAAQQENASVGYLKNGKPVKGDRMIFPELGYGGVWTTPQDYAKFITCLMRAARGEDTSLLSQAMAKKALESDTEFRPLVFPKGQHNYFGGAATGFRTQTTFDVEQNWLTVTFMNSWENWRVMLEVEAAANRKIEVN
jgi:CubicO group peptidase (beta-lactamase class C family)